MKPRAVWEILRCLAHAFTIAVLTLTGRGALAISYALAGHRWGTFIELVKNDREYYLAFAVGLFFLSGELLIRYSGLLATVRETLEGINSRPARKSAITFIQHGAEDVGNNLKNVLGDGADLLWEGQEWGMHALMCACPNVAATPGTTPCAGLELLQRQRRRRITTVCAYLLRPLQLSFSATETRRPSRLKSDSEFRKMFSERLMPWTKARRLLILTRHDFQSELSNSNDLETFIDWHRDGTCDGGTISPVPGWKKVLRRKRMMCLLRVAVCDDIESVRKELVDCGSPDNLKSFIDCAIYGKVHSYVFAQSDNLALIRDHKDGKRKREANVYRQWFNSLWDRGGQTANGAPIVVSEDVHNMDSLRTFWNSLNNRQRADLKA